MKKALAVGFLVLLLCAVSFYAMRYQKLRRTAPDQKRPSVVLIVIDALRADHLSCYGYRMNTTPSIDALAEQGTLFEKFFTSLPMTQPSFATLFTSLHPISHGITLNGKALSPRATTLAEILQNNGYQTGAVVGAFNMDSVFGLDQGFQFYDDAMNSNNRGKRKRWERSALEVNLVAFEWLSTISRKSPFFLFVHYFEPHKPYTPSPEIVPVSPDAANELNKTVAMYNGEISAADAAVGQLIQKLNDRKLLDQTLIVLTADHGEGLGEHDWYGHIWRIYDETMRVPFIMAGPQIPEGRRVNVALQSIDFAPTVLNYLRISPPVPQQGQSFLNVWNHPDEIRQPVFLEKASAPQGSRGFRGWKKFPHAQWAIRTNAEKFIWSDDGNYEFYDLENDPEELRNLFPLEKDKAMLLYQRGLKAREKFQPLHLAVDPQLRRGEEEVEEGLRALGYIN